MKSKCQNPIIAHQCIWLFGLGVLFDIGILSLRLYSVVLYPLYFVHYSTCLPCPFTVIKSRERVSEPVTSSPRSTLLSRAHSTFHSVCMREECICNTKMTLLDAEHRSICHPERSRGIPPSLPNRQGVGMTDMLLPSTSDPDPPTKTHHQASNFCASST
jgi:hypothetical protein